jgi:hypothetical protein
MTEISDTLDCLRRIEKHIASVENHLSQIQVLLNRLVRGSFGDTTEYVDWTMPQPPQQDMP